MSEDFIIKDNNGKIANIDILGLKKLTKGFEKIMNDMVTAIEERCYNLLKKIEEMGNE